MDYVWLLIYEDKEQIEVHKTPASIVKRITELDKNEYCLDDCFTIIKTEVNEE